MINERYAKSYCKEDISLIENYDKAVNDTKKWDCHHRDEIRILPNGMKVIRSKQDLIDNDRYYNCPANELIFLTHTEHISLHNKDMTHSEEHCRKMSAALKGRVISADARRKISTSFKGKHWKIVDGKRVWYD